jgi:uncharacterized protein YjbI with pentapeptide repeats
MPAKPAACASPSLPTHLEPVGAIDLLDGESVDDAFISAVSQANGRAQGFGIRTSRMTGVTLQSCELHGLEARDVIFENCDLSGSDLSESRFLRVELVGCRLSGAVLSMSRLKDVRMRDCKLDGVNLRMSESERVWISGSNMREADLYEATFRSSRILDCDLSASEFSKADLSGTQLQGSRLDGAKGVAGLRGIRIDSDQATLLAGLLLELHDISVEAAPED